MLNSIKFSDWTKQPDGAWTLAIRFPLGARIHVPCEDGRVVEGQKLPVDFVPWGGWLRVSCMAVEFEGAALSISFREDRASYLMAYAEREENDVLITMTQKGFAWSKKELPEPTPPVCAEHANVDEVWREHRRWMDKAWPTQPAYSPDWVREIPACVYLEMWTGDGTITHTFDDFARMLEAMNGAGVPEGTLVYFWGFHAPFDTRYPEYWPARELGGEGGMSKVVDTARRYGYRLMPHLNYQGCDGSLPIYEKFKHAQARDAEGNPCGWRVEGEPSIEYIRPSCAEWREHIADVCARFVSRFPVDALFLDQIGYIADDPGCNYDVAVPEYIDTLQSACPNVVFGGEAFQQRCRSLPLWQVWGTPWCGLPVREDLEHATMWRELFADGSTLTAHMGMPAAVPVRNSWPAYYWYVDYYGADEAARRANRWQRSVGAVPCVRVNFREYGLDKTALEILK